MSKYIVFIILIFANCNYSDNVKKRSSFLQIIKKDNNIIFTINSNLDSNTVFMVYRLNTKYLAYRFVDSNYTLYAKSNRIIDTSKSDTSYYLFNSNKYFARSIELFGEIDTLIEIVPKYIVTINCKYVYNDIDSLIFRENLRNKNNDIDENLNPSMPFNNLVIIPKRNKEYIPTLNVSPYDSMSFTIEGYLNNKLKVERRIILKNIITDTLITL